MAYIPHAPKMAHPLYTNNLRKLGGAEKKEEKKVINYTKKASTQCQMGAFPLVWFRFYQPLVKLPRIS